MEFSVSETIKHRRAVHQFTGEPVDDKTLDRVVSLALEAPSAFNTQLRDIVVVTDKKVQEGLVAASGQPQFGEAPVTLVAVGHTDLLPHDADELFEAGKAEFIKNWRGAKSEQERREHAIRDAMIVASFAMLAAEGEGLATGPASGFDEEKVKDALGLTGPARDTTVIALLITLGHPAEEPAHPGRKADRRINNTY